MHKGEYFLPQEREREKREKRERDLCKSRGEKNDRVVHNYPTRERERERDCRLGSCRLPVKADDPAKDGYGRARIEHELQSYTSDVVEGNDSYQ